MIDVGYINHLMKTNMGYTRLEMAALESVPRIKKSIRSHIEGYAKNEYANPKGKRIKENRIGCNDENRS